MRYEPAFFSKYVASLYTNNKIAATEAYARGFSWGLMQVMGQVARETGFDALFLSAMCDPEQGLAVGCKVLRKKFDAMAGDTTRALLAWNGGRKSSPAARITCSTGTLACAFLRSQTAKNLFRNSTREINEVKQVKEIKDPEIAELLNVHSRKCVDQFLSFASFTSFAPFASFTSFTSQGPPCPHDTGFVSLNLLLRSCSPSRSISPGVRTAATACN